MNGKQIDVIINTYKRQDLLRTQVEAIRSQSINVNNIYIWNNGEKIQDNIDGAFILNSPKNYGVWSRFYFAMNCESEFVAIFDDDTIPGIKFLENCMNNFEKFPGVYGTRGLRFLSENRYSPYHQYGWMEPNENLVEVDIVGHNWFFKKEWLSYFCNELDLNKNNKFAGEDIHLSFVLQKYLNIKTYVPPHPYNNMDLWGSLPEYANDYGKSQEAISMSSEALRHFDLELNKVCKKGFNLYYERINPSATKKTKLLDISRSSFLKRLLMRNAFIFKLSRRFYYWLLSKNIEI